MKRIFALGFFDGVHIGHQALLKECCRLAAEQNCETAAITFDSHPQSLFAPTTPPLINTLPDRFRLLLEHGIDHIHSFPVTKEVMSKHWQTFLDELMSSGAAGFVCGHDFRFGHRGEGNPENLRSYCQARGIPCIVVPEQTLDGIRVSSTHIRALLETGQTETAVRFLGHPHILSGEVISGRHLGRTLGIPTANILVPQGIICPKKGVYACKVRFDGQEHLAVTNVGSRPTVGGHRVTVEPWILDFTGDLYGKQITLEVHKFLRPEQKFNSLEQLRAAIQTDATQTREFFR